jgi:hypothetical protein
MFLESGLLINSVSRVGNIRWWGYLERLSWEPIPAMIIFPALPSKNYIKEEYNMTSIKSMIRAWIFIMIFMATLGSLTCLVGIKAERTKSTPPTHTIEVVNY